MRLSLNGLARLLVFQLVIKLPVWLLTEFRRPNYWWWDVIISDKCYEIRKKVLERGSKERNISTWREWREMLKIAESVDNFQKHGKFEFAPFVIFFHHPSKNSTWPYLYEIPAHFIREIKTKGYDVTGVNLFPPTLMRFPPKKGIIRCALYYSLYIYLNPYLGG